MKKKKKLKMIFEVVVPLDIIIDEETLEKEYKGNLMKVCQYLYKEEGQWWDEQMKLISIERL